MINEETRHEISLVALARNRAVLRTVATYLNRRSITVHIAATMAELVNLVTTKKITIALLSLDYPNGRIESLPALLKHSLKVDTIVFTEEDGRKAEAKLNQSRYKYPIQGAISGLSVLKRVQEIVQERAQEPEPQTEPQPEAEDVHYGANPNLVHLVPLHEMREGVIKGEAHSPSSDQPRYITVRSSGAESAAGAEAADHGPSEELLMTCARQALERICGPVETTLDEKMKLRHAALVGLNAPTLRGSVMCGLPSAQGSHETAMREFKDAFLRILEDSGVDLGAEPCSLVYLNDLALADDVVANSKLILVARGEEKHFVIALVSGTKAPPQFQIENKMVKVPLKDLESEGPVTFDVFLYMPVNQKYLRYLKAGAHLSREQVESLIRKDVEHVYLSDKDLESFLRYYVTGSLLNEAIGS